MLPILARAAPLQGFQGLYLQHSGFAGLQLQLQPAGALASLPHVRTLTVQASLATSVRLALPMPALSSITVLAAEEELGPISAKLVAIGRPGARGAQPAALFPALTSLDLEAGQVWLFCRAMPALASMRLHLFFPDAGLVLSEPAALAALSTLVRAGLPAWRLARGQPRRGVDGRA